MFAWTGGKIAAGTSVSADGTGSISAGVAKTLDGTLVSNGAFALQDNLAGTGLLRNAAQMDVGSFTVQPAVANDGQLNILAGIFGGAGTNAFVNAGSFTKSGAGTGLILAAFSNRGTVNVDAGTLAVTSFPSNSGTIDIAAGATFSTSGQALVNSPAGKIGGTGTLSVGGATLTNAGILQPRGLRRARYTFTATSRLPPVQCWQWRSRGRLRASSTSSTCRAKRRWPVRCA